MKNLLKKTYSIRLTIFALFSIVVGTVTILLLTLQHYYAKEITIDASKTLFSKMSQTLDNQMSDTELRIMDAIETLRRHSRMAQRPKIGEAHALLPTFEALLRQNDTVYGIYIGHENGEFHGMYNLDMVETLRSKLEAPRHALWAVMTMIKTIDGEWTLVWEFFDKYMNEAGDVIEGKPFDVTKKPWYQLALQKEGVVKTAPYIFETLGIPGVTYAKYEAPQGTVIGLDVTSKYLAQFLSKEKITDHSHAILVDSGNRIIAGENLAGIIRDGDQGPDFKTIDSLGLTQIDEVQSLLKSSGTQMAVLDDAKGVQLVMKSSPENHYGDDIALLILTPMEELMRPFNEKEQETILWTLLIVFLILGPMVHLSASKISRPVKALVRESKKIEALEFDEVGKVRSNITEIQALSKTVIKSAHSLTDMTHSLDNEKKKLEKLIRSGLSLSAEKDEDALFELILFSAQDLSNADGGTLYIKQDDKLVFEIIRNNSMNIQMGGRSSDKPSFPPVMLVDPETGAENLKNIASVTALKSKTIKVDDVYTNEEYDFQGPKRFDAANNYHSKSFLTVPLTSRHGGVIGVIQLVNALDPNTGKAVEFDPAVVPFVEALCAQAGVALENRQLLQAQIDLLDSLIKLIAGAIDAKSPYTGGHCERVPKLAEMLTRAASDETQGVFAEFALENEDQWRELKIGAWLHDCGKVTTPEYVVDKATKLETIYNRIHEIRMRFEVLWRDAEIEYLNKRAEGSYDSEQLQKELAERREQIRDDFEFVARCNVGGEFMKEEDIERLKQIATQKWQRNLADYLGLSHTELERLDAHPRPELPTIEPLLADNPWHVIPREQKEQEDAERYGFKMDIPENLYNLGEVYNLSISRGTLTDEERFKINEHVIQTIKMLEALPFPKNMTRIPEYAGTHHETLAGTGYPRRLTEEELSMPARIMAIADVFEALTASDRPYKKPKKLSDAIKILSFMAKDRHIDTDLFELFLKKGIHVEYAERYLDKEQIDEVDISKYLRSEAA